MWSMILRASHAETVFTAVFDGCKVCKKVIDRRLGKYRTLKRTSVSVTVLYLTSLPCLCAHRHRRFTASAISDRARLEAPVTPPPLASAYGGTGSLLSRLRAPLAAKEPR